MKATRILSSRTNRAQSSIRCLHHHLSRPTSSPTATLPALSSSSSSQARALYSSPQSAPRRTSSPYSTLQQQQQQQRSFSTTRSSRKGLQPDCAEPAPPTPEPNTSSSTIPTAAQISDSEYHEIADQYLDRLVFAAEELSESSDNGIDVEYSAGVLTIIHPTQGSYVINKQPPNKQIWLSSPVSGPKRYDWVVAAGDAGQHEKEGSVVPDDTDPAGDDGAGGKWIYIRDGSGLSELLKREIGVVVATEVEGGEG